jgi:hypothetical protein
MSNLLDEVYDIIEESMNIIDEAKKRRVIRKGKMIKKTFCPKGQKAKGGRCVPMKAKERTKRKMKAKKASIKRKSKMSRIKKKRAKAMRKRKAFGIR